MKDKLLYIITFVAFLLVISSVIVGGSIHEARSDEYKIIISEQETTSETLTFEKLDLKPAETVEYTLSIRGQKAGTFNVKFDFVQREDGGIAPFVDVRVRFGENEKTEKLNTLFSAQPITFECNISESKAQNIYISYTMPREVGNEAKNTWSKFDVVVTITNVQAE